METRLQRASVEHAAKALLMLKHTPAPGKLAPGKLAPGKAAQFAPGKATQFAPTPMTLRPRPRSINYAE
ncbi:hypothetical protein EBR66_05515 [bacterium]|nr:hypothetical protein [bacterium]